MGWLNFFLTIFTILILVTIYFTREKCPNCHKRGGVNTCYEDFYEQEWDDGEAYNVESCDKCGFVISKEYLGETKKGSNL